MQCYKCGSQNVLGKRFCTTCGERFRYKCPQCDADIEPGSRFCSNCAVELNWGQQQQQETFPEVEKEVKQNEKMVDEVLGERRPQKKKTVTWLIIFIVVVLCIVALFVLDTLFHG